MFQVRMLQVAAAVAVLGVWGCGGGGMSRQEFYDRAEELQADMWAGAGAEAVRDMRALAARAAGPAAARLDEGIGG